MLKMLRAIFGRDGQGKYSEALVRQAIERAVDGTDPWLRAVSGYRNKLRPSVLRAIDHVATMIDSLPQPVTVGLLGRELDPALKGYFISVAEMREIFGRDRNLMELVQGEGEGPARVVALMAMELQEKTIFGAGLSGDIVIRDVPMVTVGFDNHRFMEPCADEASTRRALKIRAFDHLLGLALRRLAFVKSERGELERHRTLLQAKLNIFERQGWGFDLASPSGEASPAELESRLEQIEEQLGELGGDSGEYEAYLRIVSEVLGNPEQFLVSRSETIYVDRMGIRQSGSADGVNELSLVEIANAEGRKLVVMAIDMETDELRSLMQQPGR